MSIRRAVQALLAAWLGIGSGVGAALAQDQQAPPGDAQAQGQVAGGGPAAAGAAAGPGQAAGASGAAAGGAVSAPAKRRKSKAGGRSSHKKKKRRRGYDYDDSRYLSKSDETHTYLFDSSGEPLGGKKKAKKKRKARTAATGSAPDGGMALGAARPKRALQPVTFESDKKGGQNPAAGAGQIPPGMLPPGMNPGAGGQVNVNP